MSTSSFLKEIEKLTKLAIEERKKKIALEHLSSDRTPLDFEKSLLSRSRNIIAEVKKMGPSTGALNLAIDPATLASEYKENGASAVSVLTEEHYFKGALEDLRSARLLNPDLPLLQKDFIIDEYQIFEAKAFGADCILLIVALLGKERTRSLYHLAKSLKLSVLVEVHNRDELLIANELQCSLIGINNRDLHSLKNSLDVSRSLIKEVHKSALVISESGIRSGQEIQELLKLGFHGFLIGSSLMQNRSPANKLGELIRESYES